MEGEVLAETWRKLGKLGDGDEEICIFSLCTHSAITHRHMLEVNFNLQT